MKKYTNLILFITLSLTVFAGETPNFVTRLKNSLKSYNQEFPKEKIYVQTDKTYYKPTENIGYKVFLTDAVTLKNSTVSKIFYVELIDPWGNVVEKHEHNLSITSETNGQFSLKYGATGGIYKLRAYTKWQKNWGEETFFTKNITVQKIITPRLLLKLDFEKRAYGAGDEVIATLKVTDLNNNKTNGSTVKSTVRIGGAVLQTLENTVQNGEATIRFRLPNDLNTPDGILQIVVTDKGIEESIIRSVPIVLNKITIDFYPEGGYMVEGVPSNIAFHALNEFGKGADVSGEIVTNKGATVARFESFHLGMGKVAFVPVRGELYFAKITKPQGNENLIQLPQALQSGYVLNLQKKTDDTTAWKIHASEADSALIVGQSFGNIYYSKRIFLEQGENWLQIPTTDFPAGTAVFTLFDGQNREQCERLVFLNSAKVLNIKIETDEEIYESSKQAKVTITTTDHNGKPVAANIGLAVVDEQNLTFADDKQDNIVSYLLFSSELKGDIQEPYFYFNPEEKKAKEALDYVMLTHGWRRFTWQEVLQPTMKITEKAEGIQSIYGYVLNENGQPADAEVFLMEAGSTYSSEGEISSVRTSNGCFVFHNINPNGNVLFVTTKLPNQVFLFNGEPIIETSWNGAKFGATLKKGLEETGVVEEKKEKEERTRTDFYEDDLFLNLDSQALDVKVVIGYGSARPEDVTGSILHLSGYSEQSSMTSIDQALQGRAAGVQVRANSGVSGEVTDIVISGRASTGDAMPLYVVDGVIQGNEFKGDPSNIASIYVSKDASANAIYGARGANGIVFIATKNNELNTYNEQQKSRYGGVFVETDSKRKFYSSKSDYYRNNFYKNESTAYWNGNVQTNEQGTAEVSFYNNSNSSTYRITAEGHSPAAGLVGASTKRIVTRKAFSLDTKLPLYAAVGDVINLPVIARNGTEDTLTAVLEFKSRYYIYRDVTVKKKECSKNPFKKQYSYSVEKVRKDTTIVQTATVTIPPHEAVTHFFTQNVEKNWYANIVIEGTVTIGTTNKGNPKVITQRINRYVPIRNIYFPFQYSFSGRNAGQTQMFDLPKHVEGTLQAEALCYTSMIDEMTAGIEGMVRKPYGCFEQKLSSIAPNIFALQILNFTEKETWKKSSIMSNLQEGYKSLAAYEVPETGGFEWFGGSPANEVLSAYALVQFHEMKKVGTNVDAQMLQRTKDFILSRKDSVGGFTQNKGRWGRSSAPTEVNNAYLVYALAETGNGKKIEEQYKTALTEAFESKSMYRMALLANAAHSMGDARNYHKLIDEFREFTQKKELINLPFDTTIVRTYGNGALRETAAFWLMALMKNENNTIVDTVREKFIDGLIVERMIQYNVDTTLVYKCVDFITKGRNYGSFGNSQTTAVCLQALSKTAKFLSGQKIEGNFCVTTNDKKRCQSLKPNTAQIDIATLLQTGENKIGVQFTETKGFFPYAVNISWQSETPPTSPLCPLSLSTELATPTVKINETMRLKVTLQNTENKAQAMSVAIIGIPGGLSLQPWQLKELQEQKVFDFYEIINDNLVIYYRELAPNDTKTINLDLKAEISGTYTGIASQAYIYYMDEHKYWIDGFTVKIE
ncbi:MAG: hypothetical protein FWC39_09900 [Bacteroidetes bacterium]|nr:hypothetical protein [Bacteroidota bacterium]